MKTKAIIAFIMLSSFIFNINKAQSQERMDKSMMHERCLDEIPDLTQEQENKINKLKTDFLKERQKLQADVKILKAEKHKLMIEDSPNIKSIKEKIKELSVVKTQIEILKAETHINIRNLLTDEQKMHLDNHRRHHQNKKMHKHRNNKKDHRNCRSNCM